MERSSTLAAAVEVLGVGPVSGLKQVSPGLLFSFFIKMKQKATSQAINNLLSRTTLTTALGTDTPSAWMCNLDTWSQKQLPYPVNKHLPPMRVKSPFIADIIIYYCHVSHQEGLEDSWAHLISTVCLYEKACD